VQSTSQIPILTSLSFSFRCFTVLLLSYKMSAPQAPDTRNLSTSINEQQDDNASGVVPTQATAPLQATALTEEIYTIDEDEEEEHNDKDEESDEVRCYCSYCSSGIECSNLDLISLLLSISF